MWKSAQSRTYSMKFVLQPSGGATHQKCELFNTSESCWCWTSCFLTLEWTKEIYACCEPWKVFCSGLWTESKIGAGEWKENCNKRERGRKGDSCELLRSWDLLFDWLYIRQGGKAFSHDPDLCCFGKTNIPSQNKLSVHPSLPCHSMSKVEPLHTYRIVAHWLNSQVYVLTLEFFKTVLGQYDNCVLIMKKHFLIVV